MEENIIPRTYFDISHEKATPTKNIASRVPPSSKFFPHKYVTLVKTITNWETTWPWASKREQRRSVTRSTRAERRNPRSVGSRLLPSHFSFSEFVFNSFCPESLCHETKGNRAWVRKSFWSGQGRRESEKNNNWICITLSNVAASYREWPADDCWPASKSDLCVRTCVSVYAHALYVHTACMCAILFVCTLEI